MGEHGGHKVTGFSKDLNCILKAGVETHARKALVSKTAILPSCLPALASWSPGFANTLDGKQRMQIGQHFPAYPRWPCASLPPPL